MRKNNKKLIFVILIIVFAMLTAFIGKEILRNLVVKETSNISIVTPTLQAVADGKYIGECSITPVYVKVEVTVNDHKITDIQILEHGNGLGKSAEVITDDIMEKQSLEIDAVSGATLSSTCILKAVENALSK